LLLATRTTKTGMILHIFSIVSQWANHTHTHTHPFNGPLSETTQVSRYQKGKTNPNLLQQETVRGSGISWTVCNSAPRSRQHPTSHFLQAGCPSCRPTNGVKALKASLRFKQRQLCSCRPYVNKCQLSLIDPRDIIVL